MPFHRLKLAGLLTALTGALILVSSDPDGGHSQLWWYALPVFLATHLMPQVPTWSRPYLQDAHRSGAGCRGFTSIGIPSLLYLLSTRFWELAAETTYPEMGLPYLISP